MRDDHAREHIQPFSSTAHRILGLSIDTRGKALLIPQILIIESSEMS